MSYEVPEGLNQRGFTGRIETKPAAGLRSAPAPYAGYYMGLDLGQTQDYVAITVAQKDERLHEDKLRFGYMERFKDVLYPDVARHVASLLFSDRLFGKTVLVIDATGVGPAVVDIFRKAGVPMKAVKIHGGDREKYDEENDVYRVPKRNLVTNLQVGFMEKRIKFAKNLPLTPIMVKELLNFRVKINPSTGHDSYAAWREGDKDDLVLSGALALWGAEHFSNRIVDESLVSTVQQWEAFMDYTFSQDEEEDEDSTFWGLEGLGPSNFLHYGDSNESATDAKQKEKGNPLTREALMRSRR